MGVETEVAKKETGFFATLARLVRVLLLLAELLMLSVYSLYIIYTMLTGPFVILKALLLAATVAYAIFYISHYDRVGKPAKKRKKIGKRIYSLIKLAVKGGTFLLTIYSLMAAKTAPTFWSLAMAGTMLLTWSISLFLEVLNYILSKILEGIKQRAAQKLAKAKARASATKAKTIAGGAKKAIGTAAGKVKSVFKNKDKPAIEAPEAEIAQLPDGNGGEE